MTLKFVLTMLIIACITACDAVKDTIKGDASTIGEIRIDDIDGEALEAVIKGSMSDNDVTVKGNDVEDVFVICCQYIRHNTYNSSFISIGGQILNKSDNRYSEVTHLLEIYDSDDKAISIDRIQFTNERKNWDFDLQPYQEYWYRVTIEADLADISKQVLTYASSVKAE
jgi:hypothetical protein